MKKLLALFLIVSTLFLSSCSVFGGFYNLFAGLSVDLSIHENSELDSSKPLDFTVDEQIFQDIDERFEKLDELLEKNSRLHSSTFIMNFSNQMKDINYIADKSTFAYIAFCKNTTETEAKEAYDRLNKLHTDYLGRLVRYYPKVYESKMSKAFFNGWSDEDIKDALNQAKMVSEEMLEYRKTNDSLVLKYQALNPENYSFRSDSAKIYAEIVENNRKMAKAAGYDSYPEFAYKEIYGRDYSPKDVQKFSKNVSKYFVPLARSINKEFQNITILQKRELLQIIKNSTEKKMENNEMMDKKLLSYYEAMGEEMLTAYNVFKKSYYKGGDFSYDAAFTTYLMSFKAPIAFFGKSYTNLTTMVHEQGHFAAFYNSRGPIASIDLCETQSQGNEWLYLSYMNGDCTGNKMKYEKYIFKNYFYNQLVSIILTSVCDAFEQYVYEHEELTPSDYDSAFMDCAMNLGAYEFLKNSMGDSFSMYWHRAIVSNSLYYISYAASMIPSIELFVNSETQGFEVARKQYLEISAGIMESFDGSTKVKGIPYDAPFIGTITSAGLSNIFEEDVYKKISDYFRSLNSK